MFVITVGLTWTKIWAYIVWTFCRPTYDPIYIWLWFARRQYVHLSPLK